MSTYRIHSIDSAPEESKRALQELQQTFGFLPNLAGAMAESPVLLDSFVGVFQKVHAGHFTEAEIQTLLLTNAVTNRSAWPVAFHSGLALKLGVAPADVQAIRERHAPKDERLAALSGLTRSLIDHRGRAEERELIRFREAGFAEQLVLELLTVIAASAMTNYAANITKPALEAAFQPQEWAP